MSWFLLWMRSKYGTTIVFNRTIIFFSLLLPAVFLFRAVDRDAYDLVFSDQIDLFFKYLDHYTFWELFNQQHGPHRQGLGSLIMLPLLKIAGWNLKSIAFLSAALLILTFAGISAFALKFRIGVLAAISINVIGLSYGSAELLTVTPNISHSVLPILLMVISLALLLGPINSLILHLVFLVMLLTTLFTGFGMLAFFPLWVLYAVLTYRGVRKRDCNRWLLFLVATPIIFIGMFFTDYSVSQGEGCARVFLSHPLEWLKYLFAIYSIVLGGGAYSDHALSIGLGFALFLLVFIVMIFSFFGLLKEGGARNSLVFVFSATSLFFVLSAATGRQCLGLDSAFASRYYLFVAIGLISVIFYKWDEHLRYFFALGCVGVILLNVLIVYPWSYNLGAAFAQHKYNFQNCLKSYDIKHCNTHAAIYPPDTNRLEVILNKINKKRMLLAKENP